MVAAVVLAAGASTRMGSAKLLLPLGGEPLVRRAVRQVLGAGFDEVLVVVGYQFQPIIAVLAGLPCRPVVNHEYQTGMGSSFRAAIAALGQTEAAMFTLADQPFVTEHEYRALLDAYHRSAGGIVVAQYGEVVAPPHVFAKEFYAELSQLERGARPVLHRHADRLTMLRFAPELLLDVDTPEDYERAIERLSASC
jgi:molybdenum cofactor cytidylyltransferase